MCDILKSCRVCGISDPDKLRKAKNKQGNYYLLRICYECDKEASKKWRQQNPNKQAQSNKKYREKNPIYDYLGRHSALMTFIKYVNCNICDAILIEADGKARPCKNCKKIKQQENYENYKNSELYKSRVEEKRLKRRKEKETDGREYHCVQCNVELQKHQQKYCKECSIKIYKQRRLEEKRKTGTHRKRARHYGCIVDTVNKFKVFERDKYKCKLCGIKVQIKDSNKSNSAHLDHILPLSKGGAHTYSNIQTLCFECNVNKGNKLMGQLTLSL